MSNPLIDEISNDGVIPHIEIALPTLAAFYPEGEVLHPSADPSKIIIGPLSVLEESTINDPMMMITGRAISKLIKRVAPLVTDPSKLSELDIQAMLIACRIVSYGQTLKLEHECPKCNHANTMEIDLKEHIGRFSPFTQDELNQFIIVLPKVGQTVNLRPLPYEDSVNMTIEAIKSSTGAEQFKELTDTEALSYEYIELYRTQFEKTLDTNIEALVATIYYVTTKAGSKVMDTDLIREWILALPIDDVKCMTKRIKDINNDIQERSQLEYQCQECGELSKLFVELDPQKLFMQAEDSETEKNSSAKSTPTKKTAKKQSKTSGRLS
jgi:hypothetical protein